MIDIAGIARRALVASPRAGSTRVVAIDGPSGAGKTMLAELLAGELRGGSGGPGHGVPIIHLDDLCPGWDGLDDIVPLLLEWVLEPLAAGRNPRYRRYDWIAGRYAEWQEVRPGGAAAAPMLIVEGVSSGSLRCAPYLSLLVFIDAPAALRMARGIERDGEDYRPHWQRWAAQEQILFARENTGPRADVIVDGGSAGSH